MQPTSTYGRIPNLEQHINIDAAVVEAVDATDVCGCCGGHLVDWWPEGLEADGAVENLEVYLGQGLAFRTPRFTRRFFASYRLLPHLHSPFLATCLEEEQLPLAPLLPHDSFGMGDAGLLRT